MQDQYLSRYAHELQSNKPAMFVDAVGPASQILNKPNQQHEHFTAVYRVIQDHYSLVASVDNVRIYVRRDRLTSQRTLPDTKLTSTL